MPKSRLDPIFRAGSLRHNFLSVSDKEEAFGVNLAYLRKLSRRTRPAERRAQRMNTAEDMTGSALFLDRDGVINVDRGYVHRPDQFEFVPGIFPLARFWTE